ncbi:MAG: hypothetical protein M4D80_09820 [Myxococcota bacterium]|nr:hypothetical protein [Myxococcota bacterium]
MIKLKYLLGSLVLVVSLGACSKGGGGDVDAFMKMDTEKAAAFNVGGETDCVAKAKSVGDWRTKNTAKYKEIQKKLNAEWPKGPPKDVQEKYGVQMKANKKAVMDAMFACTNDPAFSKMMDDTKSE